MKMQKCKGLERSQLNTMRLANVIISQSSFSKDFIILEKEIILLT